MVYELPFQQTFKLPLYEPEPACGLSNRDVEYAFNDPVPEWVVLNASKRLVVLEPQDVSLFGRNFPFRIRASLGKVETQISFAVNFIKKVEKPSNLPSQTVTPAEK